MTTTALISSISYAKSLREPCLAEVEAVIAATEGTRELPAVAERKRAQAEAMRRLVNSARELCALRREMLGRGQEVPAGFMLGEVRFCLSVDLDGLWVDGEFVSFTKVEAGADAVLGPTAGEAAGNEG